MQLSELVSSSNFLPQIPRLAVLGGAGGGMVSEIREIKVVPATDVQACRYFRYRKPDGYIHEAVVLDLGSKTVVVDRKRISQLFRYLPAKISDVRSIYEHSERDEALFKAIQQCNKELMLSVAGDRVIRIVSSDFTAVPHSKLLQIIEQVLQKDYEDRKVEFDGGMYARWTLSSIPYDCAKLEDIVSWNLWTYNYNVGNKSLRIGGGFTVLKCRNGAIGWKSAAKIRLIHRGDYEDLLTRVQSAVDEIISVDLPFMALRIQEAQQVKAARELVSQFIHHYPVWIQDRLREQLRKAHTVWDVSNAFSWVATHEPVSFNQRLQLSDHAVEVLELVER